MFGNACFEGEAIIETNGKKNVKDALEKIK